MRILFVTPFYAPEWKFGGPPRKISSLAKELTSRGHDVRVVTFHSERPNERSRHVIDSINVQYLPWMGAGLRQCPRTLHPLRQEIGSASIVHCYGLYNFICPAAGSLALRSSIPFVIEPMGMFVPRVRSFFSKRVYNAIVTRWLVRRSSAVIATSELEANELRRFANEKIVVRQNGVVVDELSDPAEPLGMRTRWGAASQDQLIGFIGRISKKKGVLELIKAFGALRSPSSKLLIAGPVSEPSYFDRVKEAINSSPKRSDIILEGLLEGDRYVAALKALDVFVLPSENENFGNSAAEAAVCGIPVLLTENCGVAPQIHGRAGIAVPFTVAALTEGLETMLKPETRQQWLPFLDEVRSELSWEKPVQVMESIYSRILGERGTVG